MIHLPHKKRSEGLGLDETRSGPGWKSLAVASGMAIRRVSWLPGLGLLCFLVADAVATSEVEVDHPSTVADVSEDDLQEHTASEAEVQFRAAVQAGNRRDFEEARDRLGEVLRLQPDHQDADLALGVVLMVMGEREAGQERLKRIAQSSEPRALRAYVLLANQASVDGRFDEAIDYYVEGSDRFPDRFSMRFNLGMTLIGQERFEEAVPVLEAALMLKPNAKSAWNNLGKSFVQLDRPRDAEACFLRTIALDERNLHAKWYLARILAERSETERANALYEEAAEVAVQRGDKEAVLRIRLEQNSL